MNGLHALVPGLLLAALPALAPGQEGVVPINQLCALAGSCLAGDAPGFPVTITATGSYRLTGNLQVPDENTTAIEVQADFVSIDLGGFEIRGVTTCPSGPASCAPLGSGRGIDTDFETNGLSVRNGSVVGMGSSGVVTGNQCIVENVSARENGGTGIDARTHCIMRDLHAESNLETGINANDGSSIAGSRAIGNGSVGIVVDGLVLECVARANGGRGITASGLALRNTVQASGESGIRGISLLVQSNSVSNNALSDPGSYELDLGNKSSYRENLVRTGGGNTVLSVGGVNLFFNACDGLPCP